MSPLHAARSVLASAFVSCALAAIGPAQEPATGRFDVRALLELAGGYGHRLPIGIGPLRPGPAGETAWRHLVDSRLPPARADRILDALIGGGLRAASGPESGDVQSAIEDGWLEVTADPATLARVPALLAALVQVLGRSALVELHAMPPGAVATAGRAVLSPEEATRLLAASRPLATLTAIIRPGAPAVLESVHAIPFVKDFDVEVAQGTLAADPLIDVIPEGLRAEVRVDEIEGGGWIIELSAERSRLAQPLRPIPLDVDGEKAEIQLARMEFDQQSVTAAVADGGAILAGGDLSGGGAWLVRVRSAGVPAAPAGQPVLPIEVLAVGGLMAERRGAALKATTTCPLPSGVGGGVSGAEAEDEEPRRLANLDRIARVIPDLPLESDPEGGGGGGDALVVVDRWAWVRGPEEIRRLAREGIRKLTVEVTRTVTLEIACGRMPAAEAARRLTEDAGALAGALPHHFRTALIPGLRGGMSAGISETYVKDVDIEVAQEATVGDPIVDVLTTGTEAGLRVFAVPGGGWHLEADLGWSEAVADAGQIPAGSAQIPFVQVPQVLRTRIRARTVLGSGGFGLLGVSPIEGTADAFVALARVVE